MFVDPHTRIPFDQLLAAIWKRNPALHERAKREATLRGQTLEEYVRDVDAEGPLPSHITDQLSQTRQADHFKWQLRPFGIDPLLNPKKNGD